jgi:hypothetical protein
MKTKNTLILLFLMFISVASYGQEDLGIMPYVGMSRTSTSMELLGEKETVTGYEIGGEYLYYEADALKVAARLGLRNINADATNLFATYEVQTNVVSIGQSVAYDFDMGEGVLSPFATFDLGMGMAKSNGNIFGEEFESETKSHLYMAGSVGARYKMGKYVPFLQGGYQSAKIEDLDFSGTYVTAGLGVLF